MDTRSTSRRSGPGWIVWLAAALLIAWIILGFVSGWQLYHVLGVVAMALLLTGFIRQMRQPRRRSHQAESGRPQRSNPDEGSSSEKTP